MASTDLSDLVRLLRFTGHYFSFHGSPHEALLTKLQKLRVVFMVVGNPFTLSSIFLGGLKNSMGIELFFGLMGLLTAIQHIHVYFHRKEVEDIIRSISRIRKTYQTGSDAEFQHNTSATWKVVQFYFAAMTALLVGYIIFPKLVDFAYGLVWNDPVTYRLPMSMNGFFEEKQHRDMKYLFITVFSISWAVISTYSHFGLDSLLGLIGVYYSSLIRTFCSRLELPKHLTPQQMTSLIKLHADHYQELYKLFLKIRSLFGYPYAVQNLFGSFCIVSLLYALLSDDSGGLVLLVANLFNFMILAGMLTSTAYVGQQVTNESAMVFHALYGLPWYELTPSDRKYFVTLICAAREPFTIHYHGRAPLNLTNFMAILNTAYSYFMFMKSTL